MPLKRNIMRAFKIKEISGVDNPAQVGARFTIMKRATPEELKKHRGDLVSILTSETLGHQHGVRVWHDDGETGMYVSYGYAEGEDHGHDHPIAKDGSNFVLGITAGHTHTIDTAAVNALILNLVMKQGDTMADKTETDAEKIERLEKENDLAKAIVKLDAAQRAHFDGLEKGAQCDFIAKSDADRKAEIDAAAVAKAAASGADPVVYTTMDGLEVRKSEGAVTLSIAKSNDKLRKDNADLRTEREAETLRKRAESELPNLPGTVDERAELLKAVDSIEDDSKRKASMNLLKAQNEAFKGIGTTLGTTGDPTSDGSPEADLDAMAKKYAADNKIDYDAAYVKVLDTDEGKELYAKSVN